MDNDLIPLLQLCDSNFPSGAFSHSFGLETYIQEQVIVDKESFKTAISAYVDKQLVFSDGLACRLSYEILESSRGMNELLEIDAYCLCRVLRRKQERVIAGLGNEWRGCVWNYTLQLP